MSKSDTGLKFQKIRHKHPVSNARATYLKVGTSNPQSLDRIRILASVNGENITQFFIIIVIIFLFQFQREFALDPENKTSVQSTTVL